MRNPVEEAAARIVDDWIRRGELDRNDVTSHVIAQAEEIAYNELRWHGEVDEDDERGPRGVR